MAQVAVVPLFAVLVGGVAQWVYSTGPQSARQIQQAETSTPGAPADPAEAARCKVPEFAKALGHEEKWKLHNNCK
jgi:hypothetical protein